jgi:peptidase E
VHAVKIHKIPVYNILEFRYLSNQIIVKHFITTDLIVVEAVKDGVAAVVEDDVRAVV